jgi:hypothetical protein
LGLLKPTLLQRGSQNLGRPQKSGVAVDMGPRSPWWRTHFLRRKVAATRGRPCTLGRDVVSDAGRVVTIKCKSCAQGIRVDGTKSGAVAAPGPATAVGAAQPETPVAPVGEPLWAVDYPDGQDREFTTAEVIAELERGAVDRATLVWRDGMAEWLEVHQVPELAGELTKIEAAKKKKAAAMAAAVAAAKNVGPVHTPRAPMPTVTGLAGLPGATGNVKPKVTQPSSPELFKPRGQQPSAPAIGTPLPKPRAQAPSGSDDATPVPFPKPRAQQPSTPDLSKPRAQQPSTPDLPKPRAQQPSTPDLPRPRAQQPSAPVLTLPKPAAAPPPAMQAPAPPPSFTPSLPLPFATPPTPPVASPPPTPTFDVTPPLPASVANVISRPPQPQPAFPLTANPVSPISSRPVPVAAHASVEWPEAKSKKPLIIVAVLVAAAIIIAAVMLLSSKDEAPPSTPISALPPNPAATPRPAAPPSPSPAAQTGAETAAGSDPISTSPDPGATPGAGFAELFAAGARKAESKGAKLAPTTRFDPAATQAPLAQAASDAQACKQSGGPTGKVTVVVTFDPNGKVSSATITEPPFAGTATATCISSALKRATIAPFGGLPGTVSKTFSIL